ncbi:MAG: tetratricopeptide repeat protein [Ascidiaceihabitans sp.]|nr:tetratricopeptide repeat protein [Ascidiaceihabitans sp.]
MCYGPFGYFAQTAMEMRLRPVTFLYMGIKTANLKLTVAAIMMTVINSLPLAAQPVTSDLLEQLKTAEVGDVAKIERALKLEWSRSGSKALDLLLLRGREAMASGDTNAAIEHFSALTDHAPNFAEGWHGRAIAYFEIELLGPALADLKRSLVLNPNNFDAVFGLGSMMMTFEDFSRAEKAFREVLRLHPNHENATNALERLESQGIGREL